MSEEFNNHLSTFILNMKNGKVAGSFDTALHTVLLLKRLVGSTRWTTAKELMISIKKVSEQLMDAQLQETSTGNMTRRVLKLVREEHNAVVVEEAAKEGEHSIPEAGSSLQNILFSRPNDRDDFNKPTQGLKSAIIDSISELSSELEACRENISAQALEHIHSNEVIMTFDKSRTVEKFLKNAARKRKFSVIVAECAPYYRGQELAKSLADSGIETTVISDAAIFAIMSRVNKVIIGTHSVMADGGLKATAGSHALALAAYHHSVPLIVCAGLFKLCPRFVTSYDQDDDNLLHSPHDVMPFSTGGLLAGVSVFNPTYDYIKPDLVNLYISDQGGNAPSYMYRLLTELYNQEDYDLA